MMRPSFLRRAWVWLWLTLPVCSFAAEFKFATSEESAAEYQRSVKPLLTKFCGGCHGEKLAEKDLNFQTLPIDMKGSTSAARWAVVLTKLAIGEMPPKDEPQPTAEDQQVLSAWIQAEMKRSGKHVAMRAEHKNGNVIDHALLFNGKPGVPFAVATRVRRLSPEIYAEFSKDVGRGVPLGQPFTPAGKSTFKDMGEPKLDEPTTSQLISNALLIAERLTKHTLNDGVPKPALGGAKQVVRLLDEKDPASQAEIEDAVVFLFEEILRRKPSTEERGRFTQLFEQNIKDAGRATGLKFALAAIFLLPEAVLRSEIGGPNVDAQGRVRLTPREIAFAISYALSDQRPSTNLLAAAEKGKLDTKEGVAAEVRKLLDDPKFAKPRIIRFFQEYFGYQQALEVFKNPDEGVEHYPKELVADTTYLIEWILEQDKDVLRELLTTNKAFVNYRWDTNKRVASKGRNGGVHLAYGLPPDWKWTDQQPIELPANQRAGILTQPSWLVSISKSDENDVIRRGKWIRERLLGNVVPDVPITVDAQLPNAPEKSLRERMVVTQEEYCWQCHRLMNRVGYPFEMYDHYGRFRTLERVLDPEATAKNIDRKGKQLGSIFRGIPVDSRGGIEFVGDATIEGDVNNAVQYMQQLAASQRVQQVFIRHAFRYWMGRNESLGDAPSLQEANQAYQESNGSMKSLITALLTSDSFLYRVPARTENK